MSSLLKKSFDATKCKTLLQLTLQRIKILRTKHVIVVKQSRDDVAKLLEKGQDDSARIRVEHVFREEKIVAAYDLLEQYCQLIINGIATIKTQKQCPSDLKEAITSLIYAAPRCADLQELQKVQKLFMSKYGTEFSGAAKELRPDCGVSIKIIEKLSSLPPKFDTKLKLLKEIAVEHQIDWDHEKVAAESFNKAEVLLDGPTHFVSASQVSKVDTPAVADRREPVFISVHPEGVKGQASSVTPNAIASSAASSKVKMSSLDPSPHNMHRIANHETNTITESKATDHTVKDHKSLGNLGVHLKPTESPKLDPYALAKAEGKMDYKQVSDFMGQAQETEKVFKGMELKQEGSVNATYDNYAKQHMGGAQDHKALKDALNHEDASSPQRSKENGEGSRNHSTISPNFRHQDKESTSKNQEDRWKLPELSEEKFTRRTSIVPSELTQERKIVEPEFLDLETAAEVAFVSAARAAEAAKAAIDMVRTNSIGRSGGKMMDSNSLQRGQYLKSSFGSGKRENYEFMEGTSKGMDSKLSLERENPWGISGKVETELNQGNVKSYSDAMHSMVHNQVSGLRAHSSLDMIEDTFKYGVFENTSSSRSFMQTSTQEEMLNTKAEAHVFSPVWDEATQNSRNYPNWLGTCDLEHEEASGSHELGSKEAFMNTSIRRVSELYSEGLKKHEPAQTSSFSRKQESSFDHTELHQEDKYVQYDSVMPQFDDYSSEDSSEEEAPFYTKGRAAMAREDYGQVAEREWLIPTFNSFTEQGSEDCVDESSKSIIQRNVQQESPHLDDHAEAVDALSQKGSSSLYQHSNVVTNSTQTGVQEHTQNPWFDDYAESVDSSSQSHTGDVNIGFRSEGSITSPIVENNSYLKPTSHRKLRWHSSTSEEPDFYSQFDEMSPTTFQESNSQPSPVAGKPNLSSPNEDETRAFKQGNNHGTTIQAMQTSTGKSYDQPSAVDSSKSPVRSHTGDVKIGFRSEGSITSPIVENNSYLKPTSRRKLRWHSSTSEEPDFYSQSDEMSPTTFQESNSQPSPVAGKPNPSSPNEDETRAFKQGNNHGTTIQAMQTSTGKSYDQPSVDSSKSPVRSHTGDVNIGFRSEGSITSPIVENNSYHKPTSRRKLRWHSSTSEEPDFYSQSDEISPTTFQESNSQPSPVAGKPNPSSPNEDETRAFKQGNNHGTTIQAMQTSTGKSYYGLSRRSVRSTRLRQNQDVLSPTLGYESTDSFSVGDENYQRYR